MDVNLPEIPAAYAPYRTELRAFIAAHRPTLATKARSGVRTPEHPEDVDALRRWVGELYTAGYGMPRTGLAGRDPVHTRIITEELEAAGLPATVGNTLVEVALEQFGTPEQKDRFLRRMRRGEDVWCQLFSEPDAGSDLASLQTRAQLDGDVYVVNGQKVWTTWGHWADYGYLLARTDTAVDKHAGISAFAIDMRQRGVEVRPLREITGTSDFNEVFFSDATVPVANRIGAEGEGWKIATTSLVNERIGTAGYGSKLPDIVSDLVGLAMDSPRGDHPAAADGGVRQLVARLFAEAEILRLLGYRSATKVARGEQDVSDAPMQKLWFSEVNLAVAEAALTILGRHSLLVEGDPEAIDDGRWQDMFLYARAYTIAGGSSEIMRNMIAERGLGLPR